MGTLAYELLRAHEEPLLAIPDAVAWCCQKGGDWRERTIALNVPAGGSL